MRPKYVFLILAGAIGLIGLFAVLNTALKSRPDEPAAQPLTTEAEAQTSSVPIQVQANSSNAAAVLEQVREAELQKELDQIHELQAEVPSMATLGTLLGKLSHPEKEVRKAAIEALVQQNDTNAIPGLEEAVAATTDAREKVALMDAIDYLKLPSVSDVATAPNSTNATDVAEPPVAPASKGVRTNRTPRSVRPGTAPAAPASPKRAAIPKAP